MLFPLLVVAAVLFGGCTVDSPQKRFQLAETLWSSREYAAAVLEFEKIYNRDPKGKLGLQALYRAGVTQTLYLSQHREALKKFSRYIDVATDDVQKWEARKQIGEILFLKQEDYLQTVQYYEKLVDLNPKAPEVPEFRYRIGKSYFYLGQFSKAKETFLNLHKEFPQLSWGEKAYLELGTTLFTEAGRDSLKIQEAKTLFQSFLKKYPQSVWHPEAEFGVAACLEEEDKIDEALALYKQVLKKYPQPKVVEIKIARLEERRAQQNQGNLPTGSSK